MLKEEMPLMDDGEQQDRTGKVQCGVQVQPADSVYGQGSVLWEAHSKLAKLVDQRMKKTAKEAVQLHEEVLLANNLDQTLRLHHVAGHAWESIGIKPLRGEE